MQLMLFLSLFTDKLRSANKSNDSDNSDNSSDSNNIGNSGLFAFALLYIMYFLLCKFIFKQNYYRHQYCSVLVLIILEFSKYFYSFEEQEKIVEFLINWIIVLILTLVNASTNGYKKFLIEKKYFSIYKTCYVLEL